MIKTYRCAVLAVVIAFALIGTNRAPALEKPNSVLAFEHLTSLVGEWKGVQGDTEIKLIYTLTAPDASVDL